MKICFYTFTFLPTVGGAEFLLHGLAESLAGRGHAVTVWAPKVRGRDNRILSTYRLCRYPRPSSKRFCVRQTLPFLIWEKFRRGIDILHCHGAYPAAYIGATAKRLFRIPMLVRPHGSDILKNEWIRKDARLERRMVLSLLASDCVVAQGKDMAKEIAALGVAPDRIEIVHNGVPRNPIRPAPETRAQPALGAAERLIRPAPETPALGAAERLIRPEDATPQGASAAPYLFSMGSLSSKKGHDILLRAFHILSGEFPNLRLVIAGGGARHLEWVDLASQLSLTDRVRWAGEVQGEDKRKLLEGAMLYVCPSRREPFSNAMLEALACGKAIVATDIGGNSEILENGKSGILVPPENPDALADVLRMVISNPVLRQKIGDGAFQRAANFDWERMVDRYEHLYRKLAEQRQ